MSYTQVRQMHYYYEEIKGFPYIKEGIPRYPKPRGFDFGKDCFPFIYRSRATCNTLLNNMESNGVLSIDSTFKASFTDMEITECKWLAHDGQAPDEEI